MALHRRCWPSVHRDCCGVPEDPRQCRCRVGRINEGKAREVTASEPMFGYDEATETSGPGGAPTPPDLVNNLDGGVDMVDATCSIEGCQRAADSRGWCRVHYARWQRHGTPTPAPARRIDGRPKFQPGEARAHLNDLMAVETDDCVPWVHAAPGTYGEIKVGGGKRSGVHAIACERGNGPRPSPTHHAAHLCGNRLCVNPRHLRWKTPRENAADKQVHGTVARGERQGSAKLTEAQVLGIRRACEAGVDQRETAEAYNVSQTTVSRIHRRDIWGWLPDERPKVLADEAERMATRPANGDLP